MNEIWSATRLNNGCATVTPTRGQLPYARRALVSRRRSAVIALHPTRINIADCARRRKTFPFIHSSLTCGIESITAAHISREIRGLR